MIKRRLSAVMMLSFLTVGLLAARPAAADSVLYSSGAPSVIPGSYGYSNGLTGAEEPSIGASSGGSVTSPFTLSGNSTVTGFGIFVEFQNMEDSLTSLPWQILEDNGASGQVSVVASGTMTDFLQTSTSYVTDDGFPLFEDSASVTPFSLGAGSYSLYLLSGQTGSGADVNWAVTDHASPSSVDESSGFYTNQTAFQVNGAATSSALVATPEPGSFTLLGTGILALAGVFRRKLLA